MGANVSAEGEIRTNPKKQMITLEELDNTIQRLVSEIISQYGKHILDAGGETCEKLYYIDTREIEPINKDLWVNHARAIGFAINESQDKKLICNKIIKHYQDIIELANKIKEFLNGICLGQARIINGKFKYMTVQGSPARKYAEDKFNTLTLEVRKIYNQLLNILESLKNEKISQEQLARYKKVVDDLMKNGLEKCCEKAYVLSSFYGPDSEHPDPYTTEADVKGRLPELYSCKKKDNIKKLYNEWLAGNTPLPPLPPQEQPLPSQQQLQQQLQQLSLPPQKPQQNSSYYFY